MTLLVAVLSLQAQRSSKRGFGEDNLGYIEDLRALAKGCSWWYNWGYTGSSVHDQFLAEGGDIDFVPMTWNGGYDLGRLREFYATHPQAKFLLGFNEPNFKAQSNMTPSQAAEKWPALEQIAEELGLQLVGPALNYPDGAINDGRVYQPTEWLDAFIAAYKEQNAGREPRMDYVALHSYMDQPQAVIDFVENFARRYDRQVWLTEFCAWEAATVTAESQRQTMIQKLALLEESEWVYRYAWFKARNANTYPYYNLVEYPNRQKGIAAGTYTALGFAYVHMSTFDKEKFYEPGEVIPVNAFVAATGLKDIQWSIDPLTRDSVEIGMQGSGLSVTYQVSVPEAGQYQLLLRAARPEGSASLKPRVNILDKDGQALVSKYTMEPGADANTYVAYVLDITLEAGQQTITIQKDNARACNLSLIRLARSFDASDPDLQTKTGTPRSSSDPGTEPTGPTDPTTPTQSYGNDNVRVTSAATEPFRFAVGEKYYTIFLDEQTRADNGIADGDIVNMGDNGSTQNSYVWEQTMTFADVVGDNSFGVTGNYRAFEVADKGWSGLGYNVSGGLDLSGLTDAYSLHIAVKSKSSETFNFYFTDGQGHVAKLILGGDYLVEVPQGASDQHKFIPMANFPRDGEWYNIDIPMSFLHSKYGLDFTSDTDYRGNLLCLNAGSTAGTDISFDAIFFHAPKDSVAPAVTSAYDMTVTAAAEEPFQFKQDEHYYLIYLDGNTRQQYLSDDQVTDCGPNGQNRQLYPWADTFTFPAATDDNSFGVGGSYMNCRVGSAGWSGLGYFVGGSSQPLNLTGITDDYVLHFAVKTTYQGMLEFELSDAMGNGGWIVLGDGDSFEGHKVMGNFPRDGRWYNIDVPLKKLANEWAVNFSTASNFTGNLFCFLAGGVEGAEVGVDAIFLHGPAAAAGTAPPVTLDDREITITRIADVARNPFEFKDDQYYYIIYMDGETKRANIPQERFTSLEPNGTTQHVYPWGGTLDGCSAPDDNSFGIGSGYMSWLSTRQGWLGLGYYIQPGTGLDLSGITSEYTLHFAVKSTSTVNYHYTVIDGNGKSCHLNLGPDDAWEDNATVRPIGDFERDNTWYAVEVPVSYLMKQGLDFATATNFRSGNVFNITAAANSVTGEQIDGQVVPVDYDAVFFYGPAPVDTGISTMHNAQGTMHSAQGTMHHEVYDLHGQRVGNAQCTMHNAQCTMHNAQCTMHNAQLKPGLYIVRTSTGAKKIHVR